MINSLYVHIPFCLKKCLYCDFNSYSSLNLQDEYLESLLKEIDQISIDKVNTIFIGGGTPTTLSSENLIRLLKKLGRLGANEFTIEGNPGTLDDSKFEIFKEYGVNRISIGLQAWQDSLLKKLGRIHSLEDFLRNYESARKWGFKNINIDLMFGLPNQSMDQWVETVESVVKLKPEHISSYGLIIEEETPFYIMDERNELILPSEDAERDMYSYAVSALKRHGYNRYEISNFSHDGFECKHNITYWRDEEYLGVGAGAHSYFNAKRVSNKKSIQSYIDGVKNNDYIEDEIFVSKDDEMSEFMFLGLRMTTGISKERFKSRFGVDIFEVYSKVLHELIRDGLLDNTGENIRLTDLGIDISNQVFVKFLR